METDEEEEEEEEREDEPQNIEESAESWEENVVVVANKEHLPLESSESKKSRPLNSEFHYELIETDNTDMYQAELDAMNVDKRDSKEMSVHSRKRHVGSYCCDVCNKEYPNYSRMMAHRRCHEADRPKYPCKHCNRIYATKQAMECHVQTFHNKTGFTCSVCQKVFAIRRSLEVHMRFHNGDFPFACNLCDKKFAQIGHLNTHKNVKHNHVRFGCDFPNCGKFFTSSTSLRNHEFTHGIMPFECQYCQRGYPAKSKLRVHIKRKHGIDPSKEELEDMRKFHVMRSKVNLVKVVPADEEEDES
ncbi:zinc finger protein 431 [Stomoxys calcitrans]|uniref:zinc finger protein 431 n=1 Tax=Stomoxys calcitrans TaxID=35570 RepID=UPI0027E23845|nr:zinc finger protein 431 [Stomoxys calcitrans]